MAFKLKSQGSKLGNGEATGKKGPGAFRKHRNTGRAATRDSRPHRSRREVFGRGQRQQPGSNMESHSMNSENGQ